jgi:putative ABC transport system permease protein
VAFGTAAPISLILLNKWLQNYPYRVGLSWQLYFTVLICVAFVVWIVIFYHAYKTTRTNPISVIRQEQNI